MAIESRSGHHPHGWGIPLAIGMLLIVGGLFALSATVLTSLVSVIVLGGFLVAAGILEILAALRLRNVPPVLTYVLAGILTIVVGALFVVRPVAGLASMTILIALYLFASGVFHGITALMERHHGWGWDFAYALFAVGLGFFVAASWPVSSLVVLGTIVAIEIIARGITLVAASWVLRDIEHGHPLAT